MACEDCKDKGLKCKWQAPAKSGPRCRQCAKSKNSCTLSLLPCKLFNIALRPKSGDQHTAGPSTRLDAIAGPSTLPEVTAAPSTDCTREEEIAEAISEVNRYIYEKEEELKGVMWSLVTSMLEMLSEQSVESPQVEG